VVDRSVPGVAGAHSLSVDPLRFAGLLTRFSPGLLKSRVLEEIKQ
jgi:hypothetical protein